MKVLHVIARVNLGGTARWLETLTAEQVAAGMDVVVATGHVQGDEIEDPAAGAMPLLRLEHLGRAVSPLDDVLALRELRDLIGDLQPDIVNTHTAKAGLLGRLASRSLGARRPTVVHTVHGHLLTGYFSPLAVRGIAMAERAMAAASDLVLVVGSSVRDDLVAARIVPPDKAIAVWPGVRDFPLEPKSEARLRLGLDRQEATDERGAPSRPVAGWLGRLTRVKRPDRLVGAAAQTPHVDFVAGGYGAMRTAMVERAPRNLTSVGWTEPTTLWSACDLAVLTSDNEGVPTSLIEAALAGLPTVTTDAGSASEVVLDGVTGFVVPRSAQAVADGVQRLVSDPDIMMSMGRAARERALDRFSPERMFADHMAAYGLAIDRRQGSA